MARILIVDDDPAILRMARLVLITNGYDVVKATDGQEAIERAVQTRPDVILLDLQMPVMNGRECFMRLRVDGLMTPVIVLSAFGAESAYRELGAQGYVNKPFDPYLLVNEV